MSWAETKLEEFAEPPEIREVLSTVLFNTVPAELFQHALEPYISLLELSSIICLYIADLHLIF